MKTSIKNVNKQILECTLKQIGQITDYVEDYYGNKVKVDIAVKTKELPRGVGFNIKKGLEVVGDPYGVAEAFNNVKEQVIQMYTSNIIANAVARMGYLIQVAKSEDKVVLRAYSF
jgi:hypothetical protein